MARNYARRSTFIERLILSVVFAIMFLLVPGLPKAHARLLCQSDYEVRIDVVADRHGEHTAYRTVIRKLPDLCPPRVTKDYARVPSQMCSVKQITRNRVHLRVLVCKQPRR